MDDRKCEFQRRGHSKHRILTRTKGGEAEKQSLFLFFTFLLLFFFFCGAKCCQMAHTWSKMTLKKHLDALRRMRGAGAVYRLNIAMSFGSGGGKTALGGTAESHLCEGENERNVSKQTSKNRREKKKKEEAPGVIISCVVPSLEGRKTHWNKMRLFFFCITPQSKIIFTDDPQFSFIGLVLIGFPHLHVFFGPPPWASPGCFHRPRPPFCHTCAWMSHKSQRAFCVWQLKGQ